MPESVDVKIDCTCKTVRHEHGTRDAYLTDKCRCAPCKEARRVYAAQYRKQKAYGRSRTHQVDAALARAHVRKLMGMGWSVELIAKGAGVACTTLARILYGRGGMPPVATITARTHDRILSFSPERERERCEGTGAERIDATGTRRRLQALVAVGYSTILLSKLLGKDRSFVQRRLEATGVAPATAAAVKALYDRIWDVPPPSATPGERQAITVAKRLAASNGWHVPMAWDDDAIDLPGARAVA